MSCESCWSARECECDTAVVPPSVSNTGDRADVNVDMYCPAGQCTCEMPCDWSAEDHAAATGSHVGQQIDGCCVHPGSDTE